VDRRRHGEQGRTIGERRREKFAFADVEGEFAGLQDAAPGLDGDVSGLQSRLCAARGEQDAVDGA
jgi:hypothetical protein